jgi:hypothetical protein
VVESGGNIVRACRLAKIDGSTPYTKQWKEDVRFQESLELARGMGADMLEAEAIRRAHDGVDEPVGFYKGEASATVKRYSDTLLIFLLKGAKPEKYAERHRFAGDDGPPIQVEDVNATRQRLAGRIAGLASRIGTGAGPSGSNGNGTGAS